MLYDIISQEVALANLNNKLVGAADAIIFLVSEGYVPNKRKSDIMGWCILTRQAFNSIDILSDEQVVKLNILYNKIMLM